MTARDIQTSCLEWRCLTLFCLLVLGLLLSACGSAPTTSSTGSKANKPAPRYQQSSSKYHKVRKGDTLYAVSWKAGFDYKTLARWNGLRAPYTIYPGQLLRLKPPLRKKKATTTTSNKKSKPATKAKSTPKPKVAAPSSKQKKSSSTPSKKKTTQADNVNLQWVWPAKGKLVGTYSSSGSSRDGIKIAGHKGQEIRAAEAGQVVYVGSGLVGYGRLIIIKHNNKYLSAYGHNSKLLVKEGDVVNKGKHIADMGLAHSGQALLHFEIRKYGKPVNPVAYLP